MSATLNWPQQSIVDACQSSEMAALLNSLYFVFKNVFLPKSVCVFMCFGVNRHNVQMLRASHSESLVVFLHKYFCLQGTFIFNQIVLRAINFTFFSSNKKSYSPQLC